MLTMLRLIDAWFSLPSNFSVLGFPSMPKLFTTMYVTERNFPQQALELPFSVFTLVLKSLRAQTSRSFLISSVQKSLLVFSNVSTDSLFFWCLITVIIIVHYSFVLAITQARWGITSSELLIYMFSGILIITSLFFFYSSVIFHSHFLPRVPLS